jgi:radical SAM protein with 4Fe4S-binding SPASM domain
VAYIRNHSTLRRRKLRYSLSTNGSLLTDEILRFLNANKFRVNLSHDGTAQGTTRPSRKNSLILENLDRMIKLKNIELETNSVFVPATAGELFQSARFLLERGVNDCHLNYSIIHPWDSVSLKRLREQVEELRKFLLWHYRRHYAIPIGNFQERPLQAMFWCAAGQERLALAADGRLWGCRFFADYFASSSSHSEIGKYGFGDMREFVKNPREDHSAVLNNYRELIQGRFHSEQKPCRRCSRLLYCSACPATAAFCTGTIGKIPAWICDIKKIWFYEVRKFWAAARSS